MGKRKTEILLSETEQVTNEELSSFLHGILCLNQRVLLCLSLATQELAHQQPSKGSQTTCLRSFPGTSDAISNKIRLWITNQKRSLIQTTLKLTCYTIIVTS